MLLWSLIIILWSLRLVDLFRLFDLVTIIDSVFICNWSAAFIFILSFEDRLLLIDMFFLPFDLSDCYSTIYYSVFCCTSYDIECYFFISLALLLTGVNCFIDFSGFFETFKGLSPKVIISYYFKPIITFRFRSYKVDWLSYVSIELGPFLFYSASLWSCGGVWMI